MDRFEISISVKSPDIFNKSLGFRVGKDVDVGILISTRDVCHYDSEHNLNFHLK